MLQPKQRFSYLLTFCCRERWYLKKIFPRENCYNILCLKHKLKTVSVIALFLKTSPLKILTKQSSSKLSQQIQDGILLLGFPVTDRTPEISLNFVVKRWEDDLYVHFPVNCLSSRAIMVLVRRWFCTSPIIQLSLFFYFSWVLHSFQEK